MTSNTLIRRDDQHDCTNEEHIDEFDIVDREEIFDECDEQTGISRHQMNIGLSRHPKNASELFNVFNRSGSSVFDKQMPIQKQSSSSKALAGASSAIHSQQPSKTAAINKKYFNDFLGSSSPQMNARSREGSRSPPALAHFAKEAFFGSSFAGNGLVHSKPT